MTNTRRAVWLVGAALSCSIMSLAQLPPSITEYSVPTASSEPAAITTEPDGALWFTEESAGKIGRITITGTITEYPIPTASSLSSGPGRSDADCITAEIGHRRCFHDGFELPGSKIHRYVVKKSEAEAEEV